MKLEMFHPRFVEQTISFTEAIIYRYVLFY